MTTAKDELVEAVARALEEALAWEIEGDVRAGETTHEERLKLAQAAIAAAQPVIVEECAKVAEAQKYANHIVLTRSREGDTGAECFNEGCDEAATAIRAIARGKK